MKIQINPLPVIRKCIQAFLHIYNIPRVDIPMSYVVDMHEGQPQDGIPKNGEELLKVEWFLVSLLDDLV